MKGTNLNEKLHNTNGCRKKGIITPEMKAVAADEILDICREYDVTISLGDACRPGCLAADIAKKILRTSFDVSQSLKARNCQSLKI